MKKFGRRFLSVVIGSVVLVNTTLSTFAATGISEDQFISGVMSEILYSNELLSDYDMNLSEFVDVKGKDEQFFKDLKVANERKINEYMVSDSGSVDFYSKLKDASNSTSGSSDTQSVDTNVKKDSFDQGSMLAYAKKIAGINMKRDSYAKSMRDETVYMYLSHFVEIPVAQRGPTLDYNSNDGYFSAWITNEDRMAYNNYLNKAQGLKSIQAVADVAVAASSLYSLKGGVFAGEAVSKMSENSGIVRKVITVASDVIPPAASSLSDGTSARDSVKSVYLYGLDTNQSADAIIDNIYSSLGTAALTSAEKAAMTTLTISGIQAAAYIGLALTPLSPIVSGVGMAAFTLTIGAYKNLFDYANWLSLAYGARARISNRVMRYYGMY